MYNTINIPNATKLYVLNRIILPGFQEQRVGYETYIDEDRAIHWLHNLSNKGH